MASFDEIHDHHEAAPFATGFKWLLERSAKSINLAKAAHDRAGQPRGLR